MKEMRSRRRRAGHLCPCPGACGPGEARKATSTPAFCGGRGLWGGASAGAWPSRETWVKSSDAAHSPWNAGEAAEEAGGRRERGGKGLTITPKHRV